MIPQESLLVTLVKLVDRIPMPLPPSKRGRGRPKFYPDRLFLKALVIMIVRHLHKVHELLSVLQEPIAEMHTLRTLLTEEECCPTRRTWERRLKAIPDSLPAQIGCLGRYLVALIQPWATCGRAAAIDSTVLRANKASLTVTAKCRPRAGPTPTGLPWGPSWSINWHCCIASRMAWT